MLTIAERVENGIQFLNKHVPDWRERVDPRTLNISSCRDCVIGQLCGTWESAYAQTLKAIAQYTAMPLSALGFCATYPIMYPAAPAMVLCATEENDWEQLNSEWRRRLTEARPATRAETEEAVKDERELVLA